MAGMKWTGYLSYTAKHLDINSELKGRYVPVADFSLNGSSQRLIDMTSAYDINLKSEFRQARIYKNISLYIPPTKNYEWHHLYEISYHGLPVSINFVASAKTGKTGARDFYLTCDNARITEQPSRKVNGSSGIMALMVNLALPQKNLIYGFYPNSELSGTGAKTSVLTLKNSLYC